MTETEPEFDAEERDSWYSLTEFETETCSRCGNLRVICHDPMRPWYPQLDVCFASADLAVHARRWAKKNEDARPDPQGRKPDDGATVWVAAEDLTPGEEPF